MAVEPFLSTTPQRAFILTITIQAAVVIAMVGLTFKIANDNIADLTGNYKTLSCYLGLFVLAELFEIFMAIDALRLRNIIQLIGILMFHCALIVFAALQVHETKIALATFGDCDGSVSYTHCSGPGTLWRRVEVFLIIAPCVIAVSWFALFFWFRQLYSEFGWAIFHVVGANPTMKSMYQWYQIMICLLKFDFFAFTGVTMQLLIVVLHTDSAEFGVTIAAIPVVLVLLAGCGAAVAREIKWLMTISLAMMLAAQSYFLFKLVRFYEPATEAEYGSTRATLTVFTIVAFLLLFSTFAVGLKCFSDFDKGLLSSKVHDVPSHRKYSSEGDPMGEAGQGPSYQGGAPMGQRISIE